MTETKPGQVQIAAGLAAEGSAPETFMPELIDFKRVPRSLQPKRHAGAVAKSKEREQSTRLHAFPDATGTPDPFFVPTGQISRRWGGDLGQAGAGRRLWEPGRLRCLAAESIGRRG
ncbi:hypothetical protein [Paracoccus beibuensis]|uniref:hypothetical protein n=1 Tax=Paracoccus beibuensis TaxID=547602 RepID=UPI00223E9FF1|nr:hypothetical protein [Paracoccus beibuensis]